MEDFAAAAFWAQQAAEFALKAFVLYRGENPPKTRNLVEFYRLVRDLLGGCRRGC